MKKIRRQTILLMLLSLMWSSNIVGQALACNDLVMGALDANGSLTIYPQDILEGGPYDYDVMEVYNEDTGEGGESLTLDCDDIGSFTVQVVDTSTGNSCWGTFTVEDKLKPVPYAQSVTVSLGGGNSVTVPASMVNIGSFDNCMITDVTLDPSTFTANGTYTSTLTVTDQSGNSDFATVSITIIGGTVSCNEMMYISLDPLGQANIAADVFIEGNADYDVMEVSLDNTNFGESVSFDCDDIGSPITVYVHVEQDGNDYNCTTEAMIEDKLAPVAIVEDFTINLESDTDTYTLTTIEIDDGSFDNCSAITYELSQTEFSIDDWGQNLVTLTTTDAGGNSSMAVSNVTVLVDGESAPLFCVSISTAIANAWGGPQLWAVDFVLNNEDFDQVLASQDPAGPFTESFIAECGINDDQPSTVYLQAFAGQDQHECSVELTVIDNSAPVAVANQTVILMLENGTATLTPEMVDNGSFDACTDITLSLNQTIFTTADIGSNTVILTVTDLNGNTNEVFTNVIVDDGSGCNLAFVIMPNNIDIYDDFGTYADLSIENLQSEYGYTYEEVHPYTVNECDGIAYAYSDQTINFGLGLKVIRSWNAIDWYTTEIITHIQIIKLFTSNATSLACNDLEFVSVQDDPVTLWPSDVLQGGPYDYNNMMLSIVDANNNIVVDNIITSAYIGQILTYTVTEITSGNSCWGQLDVQDFTVGDELTIIVPSTSVDVGTSLCLPLTVYNFNDVQAGAGTILWDPSVISYTGLSNLNLPGVGGSLNETNTSNGELNFIWSNLDPANPLSIADEGDIFVICFDVVGNIGDMSPVTLSTVGSLGFEWYSDDAVFPQVLVDGKVTISGMPCALEDEDVNYPLASIYIPDFNLDPATLSPNNLVENYGFQLSDVLITWPEDQCLIIGFTFEDDVFDYGDGTFEIVRTITVIDWLAYQPGNNSTGIWTFTQIINVGIDPASLICDFLPHTADEGDCESGHTLDDDVEWPADLDIADYRITPAELIEFSMVDIMDSEPSFYHDVDAYNATYVDLLIELNPTTLVIGRVWTVSHISYDFTWNYNQAITVDISDFENLVTINTGTNRAMPGVMINEDFSTNMQGAAYVDGEPVNTIQYEDDFLNGINILDLILIQRHIVDLHELTDYELLAADVNDDEKISASDLIQLRKNLIGAIHTEKGDWTFYNKEIDSPISIEPKGVFVGVKAGDVDDSALLQGEEPLEPTSKFEIIDILLNKGESYSIPVFLNEKVEAYGVEFRAKIDNDLLKVIDITSDFSEFDFEYYVTEEGNLTFTFNSTESTFEIGGDSSEPVFTIDFEAKENSLLSLAADLKIHHSYIASSELELVVVGGNIGSMIGTGTNSEELSSLSVYPNPTSDYLNIDLKNVNVDGALEVSVFELNGQRLFTRLDNKRIDVSELKTGMYYYQVKVGAYTTTGKFMVVN